jgi:hypothetical protein
LVAVATMMTKPSSAIQEEKAFCRLATAASRLQGLPLSIGADREMMMRKEEEEYFFPVPLGKNFSAELCVQRSAGRPTHRSDADEMTGPRVAEAFVVMLVCDMERSPIGVQEKKMAIHLATDGPNLPDLNVRAWRTIHGAEARVPSHVQWRIFQGLLCWRAVAKACGL